MSDIEIWVKLLSGSITALGTTGVLIVFVVALMKGMIRTDREFEAQEKNYLERTTEKDQVITRLLMERNQAFDELKQFGQLAHTIVRKRG